MELVSNVKVYGFEESVTASKYPKSVDITKLNSDITKRVMALAKSPKGEGHDNFLNGIVVQFDLTFTVKAWTEAERYHFLDFVSSQSTMHRITKFDLDNAYNEYVDKDIIKIMKQKIERYNELSSIDVSTKSNDYKKQHKKRLEELYLRILYSNPCGFKLTARMTTNYRQLKTIYSQRKDHRLPEWRKFCEWIKTLPYSELITNNE